MNHQSDALYVHHRAQAGIEAFRSFGLVGDHPLYLVGMQLPEHRGGPAIAALLVFADGRLLALQTGRSRSKKDHTQTFKYDLEHCDDEDLRNYSQAWSRELGGFSAVMPWAISDYDVARSLLADVSSASFLAKSIAEDTPGRELGGPPWDASQAALAFLNGVVCAVTGFSPAADDVARAIPDTEIRRSLLLQSLSESDAALLKGADHSEEDSVGRLLAEATAVLTISPRASVVLLRTVAELLVADVIETHRIDSTHTSLHRQIAAIEQAWATAVDQPSPQDRREAAWRARVIACLDSIRDNGNAIHHNRDPTVDDATTTLQFTRHLLEALARNQPLDQRH